MNEEAKAILRQILDQVDSLGKTISQPSSDTVR